MPDTSSRQRKTWAHSMTLLCALPPARLALFSSLLLATSLTEGLGLVLLVPWLAWMQSGTAAGRLPDWLPLSHPYAMLLILLSLVLTRGVLQLLQGNLGQRLEHQLVDQLRARVFSALTASEWRWLVTQRQSDHENNILTHIERIGVGFRQALHLLATLLSLAAYLIVAMLISWHMTLIAMSSGALVYCFLARQRRHAIALGRNLGQAARAMHASVSDSLATLKLIKLHDNQHERQQQLQASMGELRRQQAGFQHQRGLSQLLLQGSAAALLCAYIMLNLSWLETPISELLVLVVIFTRIAPLLGSIQQDMHYVLHTWPALEETRQLLDTCAAVSEPEAAASGAEVRLHQAMELRNISVHYQGRARAAISAVSLTLPARTTLAVVGPSGAGKSTLADVLSGLLEPDAGELLIDGLAMTGARRIAWRRRVAYVPQETLLLHSTIRSNLVWGLPEIREEALHAALQQAAAGFVLALPEGLDTLIGDRGIKLSGGERQRLALARALLRQPDILILDEATSALDHENELRIQQAIQNLHGNLTVVIISHRLSTLEHADQCLVLAQGQVSGHGPWSALQSLPGLPK